MVHQAVFCAIELEGYVAGSIGNMTFSNVLCKYLKDKWAVAYSVSVCATIISTERHIRFIIVVALMNNDIFHAMLCANIRGIIGSMDKTMAYVRKCFVQELLLLEEEEELVQWTLTYFRQCFLQLLQK